MGLIGEEITNTEDIILKIKSLAEEYRIPYKNIVVDAIGEGSGVASSSLLNGIVAYKGSFAPFKTEKDLTSNPLTSEFKFTSSFRNLRVQAIFALAEFVNQRKIACAVGGAVKDNIIEELFTYQDTSKGDGKVFCTTKEEVKESIGRSPDDSDLLQMRMYFIIRDKATGQDPDTVNRTRQIQEQQINRTRARQFLNSSK